MELLGRCYFQKYSMYINVLNALELFVIPENSRATCAWHVMTCVLQRYLAELVLAQQPLPRRQEAESLEFTSGGITQTALVTHEEVQQWATGSRKAIMCSISHAWETREHPDPCRQGTGFVLEFVLFPTTRLEHEWLLFPSLLWLPVFILHVPSRSFVQEVCGNARCGVAFCLWMWCVTCSRLISLTSPSTKWVGVVCKISRGEPTDFVDLPFLQTSILFMVE